MKKIALILFLFSFCLLSAQTNPRSAKPAAPAKTASGKYASAQVNTLVNELLHDTCLDKKFSVVFYLIQDSLYSLPTPSVVAGYSLTQAIALLNKTFGRICVSFEHCKTVIIPNYPYNKWDAAVTGTVVTENWFTNNTLNIYIPEQIKTPKPDFPEDAYTYPLPPVPQGTVVPVNAIVIEKNALMQSNSVGFRGSILLHAVGHFFGLPHTFAEINPAGSGTVIPGPPTNASPVITSLEYVNRVNLQNCKDHGDGFCDTEADPYPSSATTNTFATGQGNCANTLGLKDGHGDFYIPPCDNIMSAHGDVRCRFSQQQYNYMAYIILTRRLYLH